MTSAAQRPSFGSGVVQQGGGGISQPSIGDTVGQGATVSADGITVDDANTGELANLGDNADAGAMSETLGDNADTVATLAGAGARAIQEAYTVGYDLVGFSQVSGSSPDERVPALRSKAHPVW